MTQTVLSWPSSSSCWVTYIVIYTEGTSNECIKPFIWCSETFNEEGVQGEKGQDEPQFSLVRRLQSSSPQINIHYQYPTLIFGVSPHSCSFCLLRPYELRLKVFPENVKPIFYNATRVLKCGASALATTWELSFKYDIALYTKNVFLFFFYFL